MTSAESRAEAQARIDAMHAEEVAGMRVLATHVFRLHELCAEPACRRARACRAGAFPPCIRRFHDHYSHMLPELRRAAEELAGEDEAGQARPAKPARRRGRK